MALIKCPECGKEVSDKSSVCIGCGFPIGEHIKGLEEKRRIAEENAEKALAEEAQKIAEQSRWEELSDKRSISIKKKSILIEIYGMDLKVRIPGRPTITDRIWNFTLEYFGISMGMNIGFAINNISKGYSSGVVDVVDKGEVKEQLIVFKEIMEHNGLYAGRGRFDVIYKQTPEEKQALGNTYKEYQERMKPATARKKSEDFHGIYKYSFGQKIEVYCPRCGSSNCSHFTDEIVIPGKTKTRYTANLNPFKPFTLVNKKEKVIRKEKTITENKIKCNDCGNIFS